MPKTILITGASSGVGLATAKRFARAGWNVVATMRSPADGAELTKLGDRLLVTQLNLANKPESKNPHFFSLVQFRIFVN